MARRRGTVISLTGLTESEAEMEQAVEYDLGEYSSRPIFQKLTYPPRMSLNGLLISMLCALLLVFMGFIMIPVPSPLSLGTGAASPEQLQMIRYTLQIPMALFVAALLGPFMGVFAVFLYLATGLFFYPVFANGGGWQYISEPGFGYLLGALGAAVFLGRSFHKAFQKEEKASRSLKLVRKVIGVVMVLHGIGLLYLIGLTLLGQLPLNQLPGWILRLTVEPLPYDLAFTAILLCLVRQVRLALWIVLY